jgi:hypothetical protein
MVDYMNHESLATRLEEVRKARLKARLYTGLLVMVSSLLPVAYIVFQGYDFVTGERVRAFQSKTLAALPTVLERQIEPVKSSVNRIGQVYINEFQRVVDRDLPLLKPAFEDELSLVVDHAARRWQVVGKSIDVMADNHQRAIVEQLNDVLDISISAEEASRLTQNYRQRIVNRVKYHWNNIYVQSEPSIRKIEVGLLAMAEKEPDLQGKIAPNKALGILLEYVGLELQSRDDWF